jgi:hypothetical protein
MSYFLGEVDECAVTELVAPPRLPDSVPTLEKIVSTLVILKMSVADDLVISQRSRQILPHADKIPLYPPSLKLFEDNAGAKKELGRILSSGPCNASHLVLSDVYEPPEIIHEGVHESEGEDMRGLYEISPFCGEFSGGCDLVNHGSDGITVIDPFIMDEWVEQ